VFKVRLKPSGSAELPPHAIREIVHIEGERKSILWSGISHAIAVVLREGGL
jgi:hypothetical protein